MAGNQLGKTYSGAAEGAFHLTGRYPSWWVGRRWNRPVRAWAASETWDVTRDGVQRLLIGEPKDETQWGTGLIPGDDLPATSGLAAVHAYILADQGRVAEAIDKLLGVILDRPDVLYIDWALGWLQRC